MKNARLAAVVLTALVLLPGVGQAVAQRENENGGWGTLSTDASWEQIEDGTTADLAAASTLVKVSRQIYGKNVPSNSFAGSGGFCFDIHSGGPSIFLVEEGTLPWSFSGQQGTIDTLPTTGLALLSRAEDRGDAPVIVAPDTRLQLEAGDLVVSHHGTSCGLTGADPAVTFLRVDGFSTGPEPTGHPEYGIEVEPLDPDVGIATARTLAPRSVAVGRLSLPPGESVRLDTTTGPVMFMLEQGTISVTTSADGGLGFAAPDFPTAPLEPGRATIYNVGDYGYIPPGPKGTVINAGDKPAVALSVSVVPETEEQKTPAP